jgi:hypothetical protein
MAIDLETLQAALIGYESERERIANIVAGLRAQLRGEKASVSSGPDDAGTAARSRRKLSASARKRMAAAQKKRWAEYHKAQKAEA